MLIYILVLLSLTGQPNRSALYFDKDECNEAAAILNLELKDDYHSFCIKN